MKRYSAIRLKPVDLFKYKPFQKLKSRPDCDKLVNYIIFLYSKDSELIQEFENDLQARKDEAAKDAGYPKTGGHWPKELQEVMDIRDADAHEAIMQFLKIQKNDVWADIVITEAEYYDYQSMRFAPVLKKKSKKNSSAEDEKALIDSTLKKSTLMKACDERRVRLIALRAEFFGDNKDVQEAEFTESVTPEKAERILATMPPPYELETSTPIVDNNKSAIEPSEGV